MITVANFRRGGFCNRLLLYMHCVAYACEYKTKVRIIHDPNVDECFDQGQNNVLSVVYCPRLLWKIAGEVNEILIFFNHGEEQNVVNIKNKIDSRKSVFIRTYYFRNNNYLLKHQEKIRLEFSFRDDIKQIAEENYLSAKAVGGDNKIVAVHMRKGDYREWRGGEFYYSDDEYLVRMHSLLDKESGLHFHIISNEQVDIEMIKRKLGTSSVTSSSGNQYEDLATLSKMDYIMGPQSTYSAVAAFLGNVPLYFFERDVEDINFDMFSWETRFIQIFNGQKK